MSFFDRYLFQVASTTTTFPFLFFTVYSLVSPPLSPPPLLLILKEVFQGYIFVSFSCLPTPISLVILQIFSVKIQIENILGFEATWSWLQSLTTFGIVAMH